MPYKDEPNDGFKTLRVKATYEVETEVEVPEDYEWDGSSWDEVWGEQVDQAPASIVDWDVR